MKQYHDLLIEVLQTGVLQENRTGINTLMIPGAMMKFDMAEGFPAVTTKKLAFNTMKGELLGFLRGYTNAAQYRALGCKIWDQNANDPGSPEHPNKWISSQYRQGEDDLGYMYARLWNDMPSANILLKRTPSVGKSLSTWPYMQGAVVIPWNQIDKLLEEIKTNPTSRRLIVNAWHPEVFEQAALPPCHVMFQVLIEQKSKKMHMTMYQRSCDLFLGVPFNIASYSLLLHLIAKVTGYTPGTFTWFGADVHIYENHLDQVKEQLSREPFPLPSLKLEGVEEGSDLRAIEPAQIQLVDYVCHEAIKADMAV